MAWQWHNVAHSLNGCKPSSGGCLDRCSQISELIAMNKKSIISELCRALACLVIALSVAFFPPSAAHASGKSGVVSHDQSVTTGPVETRSNLHETSPQTGNFADCSSITDMTHTGSGSDQCCSGICLTAVLIEDPALRDGTFSTNDYNLGSTQMTHVDPNGFLRPPRQLI